MANSEAKPVDDLHDRSLKKIGELDPKTFESNKEKEIEIKSEKKQKLILRSLFVRNFSYL